MFDLKQLECFVAVGEELHFGRAAKRLFMTQPPLSRQVRLLEFELQIQLFFRNSRSVRLTPAGAVFLEEARRLITAARNAAASAQRVARGEAGVIHLGFTAGSGYSFVPEILSRSSISLHDTELVLHEMVTSRQLEALRSHQIDVGLLRMGPPLRDLAIALVAREPMMLAVPKGHRLAHGRSPSLRDLDGEPLITFNPEDGKYFHDMIASMLQNAGVHAHYVQRVSQVHSILALVNANQGLAVIPQSARTLHFEHTTIRKLRANPAYAELYLAWRKDNLNPALPRFLRLVLRNFAQQHRAAQ